MRNSRKLYEGYCEMNVKNIGKRKTQKAWIMGSRGCSWAQLKNKSNQIQLFDI